MKDYFTLLNLPVAFNLDRQALEAAYFKAQRQYHPDRFVGKPETERQQALQQSVDINNAYHALKEPLKRAQYLLHLQGITVGTEADSVKPSPALLMETMEWRERVDEAKDTKESQKLNNSLSAMYKESLEKISSHYVTTFWDAMAQETLRLGYIIKAQAAATHSKKPAP